ncbi:MAG: sulfotransferase [Shimia thalassica]|uniref:sulfotransferase n=1 Tax=Shimia thalassica TaxID=1715693 RepID=UPI0032995E0A
MSNRLEFLVYGMPRGGTSAVARYISAVDALHCGQEVFPIGLDHSTIEVPNGFLSPQAKRWNDSSIEEITRKKDSIKVYGNKTPEYFYRLPSLLRQLGNVPTIACVRNPRSVAISYSTRALKPEDPWREGRQGIFAVGDALMLVHALHHSPRDAEILIVPQRALLADWYGTMVKAINHITPNVPVDFNPEALEKINSIKTRQTNRQKVELQLIEERALRRIESIGLAELFDRDEVFTVRDVRDQLAQIVADGPRNPIGFISRMVAEHPDLRTHEYLEKWTRTAARTWRTMNSEMA